jgi:arylsulfatase A-like enzyme
VRQVKVPRRLSAEHRLSVVFIQIETLRADMLGAYGGSIAGLTPNLDRLASRSVVWDLAFTPSPWTIPSTVSHMTGLLPAAHGATDHDRNVVPGDVPTLAELARDEGIATAAIVTNDLLKAQAGYARGFTNFALLPYANARQVTALAESWLADHVGQQFFLFLHYFDPHHPFNAPGEYKTRYVEAELADRDIGGAPGRLNRRIAAGETVPTDDPDVRLLRERYLGEVAWLDAQIGRLLDTIDELGLTETTAVVFTADHGEEFLEHGLHGHGSNLYDESLHVPLMIMAPEQALGGPRRVSQVTATLGLFQTLLDVMDVEGNWVAYPDLLDRHDFAVSETHKGVLLDGVADPLRRFMVSVRTPSNLLIWREPAHPGGKPQWDFYDLRNDPGATQRKQPEGKVFDEMVTAMEKMRQWSEKHRTSRPRPGGDAALAEALRGLGYVGGGDEPEAGKEPEPPDPGGDGEDL